MLKIAVSVQAITDKNNFDWSRLRFSERTLTIPEFQTLLEGQYAFNTLRNMPTFSQKLNCGKNFASAYTVSFDFDDAKDDYTTFIKSLDVKPSLSYRTSSDGLKGHRYRAIYVFDKPITSQSQYRNTYYNIKDRFNLPSSDNGNMSTGVQNVCGCKAGTRVDCSGNIFHLDDFTGTTKQESNDEKKDTTRSEIRPCDEVFIDDMTSLSFRELYAKYIDIYPYFDHSELEYHDGYALIDENYVEIYRKWHVVSTEMKNGEMKNSTEPIRLKDGMKRRKTMFFQCLLRRKIKPDISLEHLLFNLVLEREWFFDNSDDQLNNETLLHIASESLDVDEIRIKSKNKNRFKVDKQYWERLNVKPKQAKQLVKKLLTYKEIEKYYNPDLTDNENILILKEHGIKCCAKTLQRFRREHGISKRSTSHNSTHSTSHI